tara:strand:+ start:3834 stop:4325 length:492 start_codon:yes stop_codon:yes gene_type:complete
MNSEDRLQLDKMIQANNVEDCTENIRSKKHSDRIKRDVEKLLEIKKEYSELSKSNPEDLENMMIAQCNFLFTCYTDIYNKVRKEEIDLDTLWKLLDILKRIENNTIDQHTGSYEVGNLLKKMYIDSALIKADKLDKETGEKMNVPPPVKAKEISWKEYKMMKQ